MKRNQKKNIGYKITKKLGSVARDKSFKNPFDKVGKLPAYLYKKTISPIIHKAAFNANRALGYKRGSAPIKGSIRYTILSIMCGLVAFVLFSCLIQLASLPF